MNRIDQAFSAVYPKKVFSVYLTAGYPTVQLTEKLVLSLANVGVDFFEIGMPFSDPIADGPTIQKASEIALRNGMNWEKYLSLAKKIRKNSETPLIAMGYANSFFCRGWEKSIQELAQAGYDGAVVPDLIPEESVDIAGLFAKHKMALIYLVAPTSTLERIKMIGRQSKGFVYCVSVTGVTGARNKLDIQGISNFLSAVKEHSHVPTILGFGISTPQQCRAFENVTDGFVIGSKMIETIGQPLSLKQLLQSAEELVQSFKKESA